MKFEGSFSQWISAKRDYQRQTISIWIDRRLEHRISQFTDLGLEVASGPHWGGTVLSGDFTPELHELLTDCFGFPSAAEITAERTWKQQSSRLPAAI